MLAEIRVGYSRLKVLNLQEDYEVDVVNCRYLGPHRRRKKTPFNNGAPRVAITGFRAIPGLRALLAIVGPKDRLVFTQSANIFFRELNRAFTSILLALSSWGA